MALGNHHLQTNQPRLKCNIMNHKALKMLKKTKKTKANSTLNSRVDNHVRLVLIILAKRLRRVRDGPELIS